ncbi:MAG: ATP-binding protein [Gemmatales bacterium]
MSIIENLSSELSQLIFVESVDALLVVDSDFKKILDANKTAQDWTGLSYQELLNSKFEQLVSWREAVEQASETTRHTGSKHRFQPALLRYQQKQWMPVEGARLPIPGTRSKKSMLVLLRDARTQFALETGNRALMERLAEAELENTQLKESNIGQNSFYTASERDLSTAADLIQGISKHYNDLATVVIANSTLVRSSLNSTSPNQSLLQSIEESAGRAASLLQNLLAAVGRASFQKREYPLGMLVDQALEIVKPAANIEINASIPASLGPIICDGDLLKRVFVHLIQNAVDAMQLGGRLSIDAREKTLDDRHLAEYNVQERVRPGEFIRITVTDTGTGMSPEILEKAGTAFFTTRNDPKRIGLGIALVRGVVRQHGGFLDLQSKSGQGTTASIYLPKLKWSKPAAVITQQ